MPANEINKHIQDLISLANEGRFEEVFSAIEGIDNADTLYIRGRIAWQQGKRGEAISYYEKSAALEPDGIAAKTLEQVREIMNFYHRDLYNP